jgi:uncharacterized protein YqgV (UPF0045/DUF77 family)
MKEFNFADLIMSGVTFGELIETLQANERVIDEEAVLRTYNNIIAAQQKDANHILRSKMEQIIKAAK